MEKRIPMSPIKGNCPFSPISAKSTPFSPKNRRNIVQKPVYSIKKYDKGSGTEDLQTTVTARDAPHPPHEEKRTKLLDEHETPVPPSLTPDVDTNAESTKKASTPLSDPFTTGVSAPVAAVSTSRSVSLASSARETPLERGLVAQVGPAGLAAHRQVETHVFSALDLQCHSKSCSVPVPEASASFRSGERSWLFSVDSVATNPYSWSQQLNTAARAIVAKDQHTAWLVASKETEFFDDFISHFFRHLFDESDQLVLEMSVAFLRGDNLYDAAEFSANADPQAKPRRLKISVPMHKRPIFKGMKDRKISSYQEAQNVVKTCSSKLAKGDRLVLLMNVPCRTGRADMQIWRVQWGGKGIHSDPSMRALMNCTRVIKENACRKKQLVVPFRTNAMARLLYPYLTSSNSKIINYVHLASPAYRDLVQSLSFSCTKSVLMCLPKTKPIFTKQQLPRKKRRGQPTSRTLKSLRVENLKPSTIQSTQKRRKKSIKKPRARLPRKTLMSSAARPKTAKAARAKGKALSRPKTAPAKAKKARTLFDSLRSLSPSAGKRAPESRRMYRGTPILASEKAKDEEPAGGGFRRDSANDLHDAEYDKMRAILSSTRRSLEYRELEIQNLSIQLDAATKTINNLSVTIEEVSNSKIQTIERKDETIALMQRRIVALEQELSEAMTKYQGREDELTEMMVQSKKVIEVLVEELNLLSSASQKSELVLEVKKHTDQSLEVWNRIKTALDGAQNQPEIVKNLYQAMTSLLEAIQSGHSEKAILEEKMEEFESENKSLKDQLSSSSDLRDELAQLRADNAAIRQELDQETNDLLHWKEQASQHLGGMQQLREELFRLKADPSAHRGGVEASQRDSRNSKAQAVNGSIEEDGLTEKNRGHGMAECERELQGMLQESENKRARLKIDHEKVKSKLQLVNDRRLFLEKEADFLDRKIREIKERHEIEQRGWKEMSAEFQEQKRQREQQIRAMETEMQRQKQAIVDLKSQLGQQGPLGVEHIELISDLQHQMQGRREELQEQRQILDSQVLRIRELERHLGDKEMKIQELETLQAENEDCIRELEKLQAEDVSRIRDLEAEKAVLETGLREDMEAKAERIARLEEAQTEKAACIAKLKQAEAARDARIKELQQVQAAKDTRIADLETAASEKEADIAELHAKQSAKDSRIAELEKSQLEKQARLLDLGRTRNEREMCIAELRKIKHAREAQILELEELSTAREACIQTMQEILLERDAQIHELREAEAKKDECIRELECLKAESKARIEELQKAADTMEQETSVAAQSRDMRIKELEVARGANESSLGELESLKTEAENQIKDLQKKVSQLETSGGTKDARIAELETGHHAKDAQIAELTSSGEAKEARIARLESGEQAAAAQIAELTSGAEAKEARIAELESGERAKDASISELEQAREESKNRVQELEAKLSSFEQRAQAAYARIIDLEAAQSKKETTMREMESAKIGAESVIRKLEEQITRLCEEGKCASKDLNAKMDDLKQRHEERVCDLGRALSERDVRIQALEECIRKLEEAEKSDIKHELLNCREKVHACKEDICFLRSQVEGSVVDNEVTATIEQVTGHCSTVLKDLKSRNTVLELDIQELQVQLVEMSSLVQSADKAQEVQALFAQFAEPIRPGGNSVEAVVENGLAAIAEILEKCREESKRLAGELETARLNLSIERENVILVESTMKNRLSQLQGEQASRERALLEQIEGAQGGLAAQALDLESQMRAQEEAFAGRVRGLQRRLDAAREQFGRKISALEADLAERDRATGRMRFSHEQAVQELKQGSRELVKEAESALKARISELEALLVSQEVQLTSRLRQEHQSELETLRAQLQQGLAEEREQLEMEFDAERESYEIELQQMTEEHRAELVRVKEMIESTLARSEAEFENEREREAERHDMEQQRAQERFREKMDRLTQDQTEQLHRQKKEFEGELTNAKAELERQAKQHQNEMEYVRDQMQSNFAEFRRQSEQNKRDQEDTLESLQNQLTHLEKALATEKSKVHQLQGTLEQEEARSEEENSQLRSALEEKEREVQRLTFEIAQKEREISSLEATTTAFRDDASLLRAQLQKTRDAAETLTVEKMDCETAVQQLTETVALLNERSATLERDNKAMSAQIEKSHRQQEVLGSLRREFEAHMAHHAQNEAKLVEANRAATEKASRLERALKAAEEEAARLRGDRDRLERGVSRLEEDVVGARTNARRLSGEWQIKGQELQLAMREKFDLERELEKTKLCYHDREQELLSINETLINTKSVLEEELREAHQSDSAREVAALERRVAEVLLELEHAFFREANWRELAQAMLDAPAARAVVAVAADPGGAAGWERLLRAQEEVEALQRELDEQRGRHDELARKLEVRDKIIEEQDEEADYLRGVLDKYGIRLEANVLDLDADNTTDLSSDFSHEAMAFEPIVPPYAPCSRITETKELNPMECEIEYLSRVYALENDKADLLLELEKWKSWKHRADTHGKQLANTLKDRDIAECSKIKMIAEQEQELDSLRKQLVRSHERFQSVESLMEQDFKDLYKQNNLLQTQLEKCQEQIKTVSQDKLGKLMAQISSAESAQTGAIVQSVQQMLDPNVMKERNQRAIDEAIADDIFGDKETIKQNNEWAVRAVFKICAQIDVIMSKNSSQSSLATKDLTDCVLADAIDALQMRVDRIQQVKDRYSKRGKASRRRTERQRRYSQRESPQSSPHSRPDSPSVDGQCSIS